MAVNDAASEHCNSSLERPLALGRGETTACVIYNKVAVGMGNSMCKVAFRAPLSILRYKS